MHYIENFGTGIPRILHAYEGKKEQPEFEATENFFKVVLPNLNYGIDPLTDPLTDPILDPLSDLELLILQVVKNTPGLNSKQITEKLTGKYEPISLDRVKNALKRILSKYCEFRGARSNGGYHLK